MPFDGLKEDIAFADVDISAVPPYEFSSVKTTAVRVLFVLRPRMIIDRTNGACDGYTRTPLRRLKARVGSF
jgi:hypothetical protein